MKKTTVAASVAVLALALASSAAEAGRRGSHRVGGYNSHGKGSHYIGGHSQLEVPGARIRVATQCNDGSYSSSSGKGTCSHHGGENGG